MIVSDYIVCALAVLMWNEPKEDSFLIMTACGLVVRNRVLAGWEGGNWLKLIQDHDKYSAQPDVKRALVWGDPIRDDRFRRCLGLANNVYEGREKDITVGALRYCRLNEASEEFCNKIIRLTITLESGAVELVHKRIATIGQWQFFK